MTQITITEFSGYEKPAFQAYLKLYRDDFIDLILPKEYEQHYGTDFLIDYYKLLYVMQTLHPFVDTLLSNLPPPEKEVFSLIILYKPSQQLYDALWYLKQGYDKADPDQYTAFESRALDINSYILDSTPVAGPHVLEFINNYPDKNL